MRRALLPVLFALFAVPSASCSSVETTSPHVRVVWGALGEPSATIPDGVESLLLLVYLPDSVQPEDSAFTVASLEDADGNGRPEIVRPDLPVGVPIRMVLLGGPREDDWTHVGAVGPLVLSQGERRYIDIRMYSLDEANVLAAGAPSPRFLSTATALPDARVLVAGGFDRASATSCPALAPPGSSCFELTASDEGYIFEPATGRFHPLRSRMLAARGGHTASLLPDGRVLIAGGASQAVLVITEGDAGHADLALIAGSDTTTPSSYELFEPNANPEEEDLDADGDPGRGGFIGAASDPGRPGPLDAGRLLHAAAALSDGRVVLTGGLYAARSFTVWDVDRPGGYGVLGTGPLPVARPAPGAAALGTGSALRVFVAGGGEATRDEDLADIWLGEGLGEATSANIATSTGAPQWNLVRPIVETAANGRGAFVLGWYGPWCAPGLPDPDYGAAHVGERCAYAPNRAFTFEVATNRATASPSMRPHGLAAAARLDDGSIIVAGGLSDLSLETNGLIDVYGNTISSGSLQLVPTTLSLRQRRALHAMAALPEGGALAFGGVTFGGTAGARTVALVAAPEVVFAPRRRGRP